MNKDGETRRDCRWWNDPDMLIRLGDMTLATSLVIGLVGGLFAVISLGLR